MFCVCWFIHTRMHARTCGGYVGGWVFTVIRFSCVAVIITSGAYRHIVMSYSCDKQKDPSGFY